ncbi:MAG: methionine--tRNA ligase [Candidatus Peregrinibacteria bacterium]
MSPLKPFYITTSIAYVNGVPHVGFAMESIEADVLARWARKQGRETFFLTGTDEHGSKVAKTAKERGILPQELCDENSAEFQKLGNALTLSNDDFIRTTDKERHWTSAQKIWEKLAENGDLEKRAYTAQYCSGCETFLTEKDLVDGLCPFHKVAPETVSEENYFFKLSKYSQEIAELLRTDALKIVPDFRKNEILKMAEEGFTDVSFSRPTEKVSWGIPVPGDLSQTMYVWCDALTNYISALGYGKEVEPLHATALPFQKFWNSGEVVHVIGKDILRFHAGIWIGMLLSAGIKTPDKIFVHGFLTSEGEKMSKSLGNVVDPFLEVEKYGTDALRYFLLREVPVGRDADFSRQRFEEIYQAHLANGIGNLSSRVHKLCERNSVEPLHATALRDDFTQIIAKTEKTVTEKMDAFLIHEAIQELFLVVDFCDKRMDEEKPWLANEDGTVKMELMKSLLITLRWFAMELEPFLTNTAQKMKNMFGDNGEPLGEGQMLFPRLEKLA